MLISALLLRFKADYLEKIHGYPNFSLWIPIALAKIYFIRMVLIWRKNSLYLEDTILESALVWLRLKERLCNVPKDLLLRRLHRNCPRLKIFKIFCLFSEYQGSDGLDGVESLITNVGGRLLMLQKDKAYPERKSKKVPLV